MLRICIKAKQHLMSNSLGVWRDQLAEKRGTTSLLSRNFWSPSSPADHRNQRESLDAEARPAFGVSFSACHLTRCMYCAPVSFSPFQIHCTDPTWCQLVCNPSDSRTQMLTLIALKFPSPILVRRKVSMTWVSSSLAQQVRECTEDIFRDFCPSSLKCREKTKAWRAQKTGPLLCHCRDFVSLPRCGNSCLSELDHMQFCDPRRPTKGTRQSSDLHTLMRIRFLSSTKVAVPESKGQWLMRASQGGPKCGGLSILRHLCVGHVTDCHEFSSPMLCYLGRRTRQRFRLLSLRLVCMGRFFILGVRSRFVQSIWLCLASLLFSLDFPITATAMEFVFDGQFQQKW